MLTSCRFRSLGGGGGVQEIPRWWLAVGRSAALAVQSKARAMTQNRFLVIWPYGATHCISQRTNDKDKRKKKKGVDFFFFCKNATLPKNWMLKWFRIWTYLFCKKKTRQASKQWLTKSIELTLLFGCNTPFRPADVRLSPVPHGEKVASTLSYSYSNLLLFCYPFYLLTSPYIRCSCTNFKKAERGLLSAKIELLTWEWHTFADTYTTTVCCVTQTHQWWK